MGFLGNLFKKKEKAERPDSETLKERMESGKAQESEQRRPDVDELERKEDFRGLIKALAYKDDWHVRADASWVLGELQRRFGAGSPILGGAVEPLIEALKDENEVFVVAQPVRSEKLETQEQKGL